MQCQAKTSKNQPCQRNAVHRIWYLCSPHIRLCFCKQHSDKSAKTGAWREAL